MYLGEFDCFGYVCLDFLNDITPICCYTLGGLEGLHCIGNVLINIFVLLSVDHVTDYSQKYIQAFTVCIMFPKYNCKYVWSDFLIYIKNVNQNI